MSDYLPFEKAIEALEQSAANLRRTGERLDEAAQLEERAQRQLGFLYSKLTPWQRAMVARHPARPHINHYIDGLFTDFMPLGGGGIAPFLMIQR